MSQFLLEQENSPELRPFVHINEFALKKNNSIRLNSFNNVSSECLRLYYILEGKFDWVINGEYFTLYPTDLAIILPGQELYAEKGYLEIGSLYWLNLHLNIKDPGSKNVLRKWSNITSPELITINKILFLNSVPVVSRLKDAGSIFSQLRNELFSQEIGYVTRVNHLIDELLILITRRMRLTSLK